jgi:hypothetical protein
MIGNICLRAWDLEGFVPLPTGFPFFVLDAVVACSDRYGFGKGLPKLLVKFARSSLARVT